MKRGGPLKRHTRLKPVNPERRARRRAEEFGAQAELCSRSASPTCARVCAHAGFKAMAMTGLCW